MATKKRKKRVPPPPPRHGHYDPILGKRPRLKTAPDFKPPRRKAK